MRRLFIHFGMVNEVAMVKNWNTGKSMGFAYVTMNSLGDAKNAIDQYNGQGTRSMDLTVILARPLEQRTWSKNDSNQGPGNQSNISRNRNDGNQPG